MTEMKGMTEVKGMTEMKGLTEVKGLRKVEPPELQRYPYIAGPFGFAEIARYPLMVSLSKDAPSEDAPLDGAWFDRLTMSGY